MATTAVLSPGQNDRLREAMLKYRAERFGDKSQPMAHAMGLTQPTISEFLRGKNGASLDTAQRFAALLHEDVWKILGPDERVRREVLAERGRVALADRPVPQLLPPGRSGPRPRRNYRDLPGYVEALRAASQRKMHWSAIVWEGVGSSRVPPGVTEATADELIQLGERYAERESSRLEPQDYLSPATPRRAGKTPYKRHMSDIRRLAAAPEQLRRTK